MRTVIVALVATAILAVAGPAQGATVSERRSLEAALVDRINAVRRNHGLRTLRLRPSLLRAADRHAHSMGNASYFRHELLTPRRADRWTEFSRWIRWFYPGRGYRSWSAGENLAWGAPNITARQTVRRWLRSPAHRANMLTRGWRHLGVGAVHVRNPSGVYGRWNHVTIVVAEFGRRS